ncbi:hypothetical protein F8388_019534 [Cannabis sativa]|uniref:Transposase MuDR plant domain-containing protein n=1 Tax=Cannabis sativa TaxID=3483 RepID=A0A7J6HVQ8_CANSA|nr:hypothetical protein F8388_019534 [Cannabis sativa]KAF4398798.1 hypothetical protein G4B88_028161 [Cannabis sativa]
MLIHGASWFSPFGNRRYEGGSWEYFNHYKIEGFTRLDLEDMLMLEDLTSRNNSEANVYLVLPDPQVALEWEEDAEAVKMQQPEQSSKVEKCKIEELPEGCTVVPDVVVNPLEAAPQFLPKSEDSNEVDSNEVEDDLDYIIPPEMEDYMICIVLIILGLCQTLHKPLGCKDPAKESDSYAEPDGPKSPNVVVIGFKEPLEETSTDKRLRLRRMRKAQPQTQAPDSRDELHRVHIDDEDGDHTSKLEFNPQTKNDDFKFELNIEFGSIKILRAALKEHFIHIDREYILIHNDKCKFRGKCNAERCPRMINEHVQSDGMIFKITTISEGGH